MKAKIIIDSKKKVVRKIILSCKLQFKILIPLECLLQIKKVKGVQTSRRKFTMLKNPNLKSVEFGK